MIEFPAALMIASAALAPGGQASTAVAKLAVPAPSPASYLRAEDYRVARIAYRIGLAGLPLCPQPYPLTGLLLHHLDEYAVGDRQAAIRLHALDKGPSVLAVVEDSPAARGGLVAGDVLLAVNGRAISPPAETAQPKDARSARIAIEALERQLEDQFRAGPTELTLLRGNDQVTVRIVPVSGCPARVRLARSGQLNAFANRGYTIMTTKLLAFARSDDEVAIILGHEMAHNILRHPETLDAEGVPHGILRGFGRNAGRVKATEEAADRLGLKLAWAAGYDLSAAIPFWRRYNARSGPFFSTTHPGPKTRERLIEQAIAELSAKKAQSPGQ